MKLPSLFRVCLAAFVLVSGTAAADLQGVLDGITVAPTAGQSSVNVAEDALADSGDSYWELVGPTGGILNLVANQDLPAGFIFGVYETNNVDNRVPIYSGPLATNTFNLSTLEITGDGSVLVALQDTHVDFAVSGNSFGFYLETSDGSILFSDSMLNVSQLDHMKAVQGPGDPERIKIGPWATTGIWGTGEHILGWDYPSTSDPVGDFDDFVVSIESIIPAPPPEPLLGSLGDFVWNDLNGNGIQDVGEPGVPGVTVQLLDCSNNVLQTTTTGPNGEYLFSGLLAGGYKVKFIPPADFGFTSYNEGSNDAVDSDADPDDMGRTTCIELGAGQNIDTIDAGLVQTASLGDYVWEDLNGDGIQNDGVNAGINGVTVNLLNCDTGGVIGTQMTMNDDAGNPGYYLFDGLEPGNYCVEFVLPGGYEFTGQDLGGDDALDSDADITTGRTVSTDLVAGENDPDWDAGLYRPASIGNFVWFDLNRDGLQTGEAGFEGVTVSLFECGGNTPIASQTSGADGSYLFEGLAPGSYFVEFSGLPAGYEFSAPGDGSNPTIDSDAPTTACTELASGGEDLTLDAGVMVVLGSSLGDFVWNDLNADGIQDDGEPGIPGVTVNLLDCSGNPVTDLNGDPITTTTGANGMYLFDNLSAGDYIVQFETPAGYYASPANAAGLNNEIDSDAVDGKTVCTTLGVNEANLTLDAGFYQPASLGDFVWLDADANGIQDSGEAGVGGVTVMLFDCSGNPVVDVNGNAVAPVTTDASGSYSFDNLKPGQYTVMFTAPDGFDLTTANSTADGANDDNDSDANISTGKTGCYTLVSGQNDPTVDAGLVPVPVAECDLSVTATCAIVPPLSTGFVCSDAKPLDELSMKWNGEDNVTVVAYYGKVGDGVLGTMTEVDNGQIVTFAGFAGAGNDIEWQVFAADGSELGISRFHLSCSDSGMNGPEDCGMPQGNSKDDDSSFLNDWLLEGLKGDNDMALQCTPPEAGPGAEACEFTTPAGPHCEGKVESISLRYIGGDCIISNTQDDKAECLVSGTAGEPVRIKVSDGGSKVYLDTGVEANVNVGDVVTASAIAAGEDDFGSNTVLEIYSAGGTLLQEVEFHTSCSKPLNLGDQFGAVEVVGLDTTEGGSASLGADVLFRYSVTNNSIEPFADDAKDSFGSLGSVDLAANGGSAEFDRTVFVTPDVSNVYTNTFMVTGALVPSNTACSASASVDVTLNEPPPPQLACSEIKPITELSMVWNGPSGVNVLTAGGQYFADVQTGKLITFDVTDLGNEVGMTLSGSVVGASSFHVSCSDDGMDGPEDCGSAQGNSKDDDPDLENQWLLEAMIGETGSFSCDLPNTGTVAPSDDPGTGGGPGGDSASLLGAEVNGKKLILEIESLSSNDLLITSVFVGWDTQAGLLKKMKFDGDFAKDINDDSGSTLVTEVNFEDDAGKRTLGAGDARKLEIEFDEDLEDLDLTIGDFVVVVEFDDGTTVNLN